MPTPEHVIGWKLDPRQRTLLLARFPPRYGQSVADHVTLQSHVGPDAALPEETRGELVGRADDGRGVEAMVVRIGGSTQRPGGGTFHITWSLAEGRKAQESNQVIAQHGWEPLDGAVEVTLQPRLIE